MKNIFYRKVCKRFTQGAQSSEIWGYFLCVLCDFFISFVVKKRERLLPLFALALLFSACEKTTPAKEETQIEMTPTTYSLQDDSCRLENIESKKVIMLHGDEELGGYILYTGSNYPDADFAEQSLYLMRTWAINY